MKSESRPEMPFDEHDQHRLKQIESALSGASPENGDATAQFYAELATATPPINRHFQDTLEARIFNELQSQQRSKSRMNGHLNASAVHSPANVRPLQSPAPRSTRFWYRLSLIAAIITVILLGGILSRIGQPASYRSTALIQTIPTATPLPTLEPSTSATPPVLYTEDGQALQPVVVARNNIPPATVLTADMLEIAYWPAENVLPRTFSRIDSLIGLTTSTTLTSQSPILESMVLQSPSSAIELDPGYVGISLPAPSTSPMILQAGDTIDIFIQLPCRMDTSNVYYCLIPEHLNTGSMPFTLVETPAGNMAQQTMLQNIEVVHVGQLPQDTESVIEFDDPSDSANLVITLQVLPEQADFLVKIVDADIPYGWVLTSTTVPGQSPQTFYERVASAETAFADGNLPEAITNYSLAYNSTIDNGLLAQIRLPYVQSLIYHSYMVNPVERSQLLTQALSVSEPPVLNNPDPDAESLTAYAFALLENGRYNEAVTMALRAIEIEPNWSEPHAYLSMAYVNLERFATADDEYDRPGDEALRAVSLGPNSVDARRALALALTFKAEWNGALRQYEALTSLHPNLLFLHFEFAAALLMRDNYEAALNVYNELLERDPENVKAYTRICETYFRQRDDAAARTACEQAIEIDPESALAHKAFGTILYTQRNYADSIESFATCVRIMDDQGWAMSDRLVECYSLQGLAHYTLNQCEQAMPLFETALLTDPQGPNLELIQEGIRLCSELNPSSTSPNNPPNTAEP